MKDGSEQPDQARQAPRPGGRKVVPGWDGAASQTLAETLTE